MAGWEGEWAGTQVGRSSSAGFACLPEPDLPITIRGNLCALA